MADHGFLALGVLAVASVSIVGSRTTTLHPPRVPPSPALSDSPAEDTARPIVAGAGAVVLKRATDRHFYADARINGTPVRLLVDTGASALVLTRSDALRVGIGAGDYAATGIGAGGAVRLMPVTLARVAIGPLASERVDALVAEGGLPVSLLGQSWLDRVGSVTIRGDEMVLRQARAPFD